MNLKTILCVEDDEDIQMIAHMALVNVGGFTIEICSSGQEALEKVKTFQPNLILLDVMIPGMDGQETFARLKEIPEAQNIPVIFMTAKAQTHEVEKYKQQGALGVIIKPFDPMTLPDTIREIWDQQ